MEKIIEKIRHQYPNLKLIHGKRFAFRPPNTIIIGPPEPHDDLLLLHELGHALLKKNNYITDIERLKIESEAWDKARILAQTFNVPFDQYFAEKELNSYRDWLHQKSLCKKCHLTRYQTEDGEYHCPYCNS